ncbi:hypothetical protein HZ326_9504 [Fusarium oxysporum f. sp. albedinis]|nr:hypothetical protein HZ326_9504 [Fusarium oxysporum f. sp. albedinis]
MFNCFHFSDLLATQAQKSHHVPFLHPLVVCPQKSKAPLQQRNAPPPQSVTDCSSSRLDGWAWLVSATHDDESPKPPGPTLRLR